MDLCSDQCWYSFNCSFGDKGNFLHECLFLCEYKWLMEPIWLHTSQGWAWMVNCMCYSLWSYFSLFAVEILENTVFLAVVFFFFIIGRVILVALNTGLLFWTFWMTVMVWLGRYCSMFCSTLTWVIGHFGPFFPAPKYYQEEALGNISQLLGIILL